METPPRARGLRASRSARSNSASAVVVSIAADDRGPRLGGCSRADRGPAVHDDAREGAARDGLVGQARHESQRALHGPRGLPADPLPATSRQTVKLGRMARGCSPEGNGPRRPTDVESRTLRPSLLTRNSGPNFWDWTDTGAVVDSALRSRRLTSKGVRRATPLFDARVPVNAADRVYRN
jgi:hypothetical protein